MNPWETLFRQLADSGAIAEWQLANGVTFFMTLPRCEAIESEGINTPSLIRFDTSVRLTVRSLQPLGGLSKVNDLAALRTLATTDGLAVREEHGLIEFRQVALSAEAG